MAAKEHKERKEPPIGKTSWDGLESEFGAALAESGTVERFCNLTLKNTAAASSGGLVEEFLETGKNEANFLWLAEVGHRVGDGVVVFKTKQGRELFLVEFLDAFAHIM